MSEAPRPASPPSRPRRVRTLPRRYRDIPPLTFNAPAHWVPPRAAVCRRDPPRSELGTASRPEGIQSDVQAHRVAHVPRISGTEDRGVDQAQRHQRTLLQKDAELESLKSRIRHLERSEKRAKARLIKSNDEIANKDAELGEVRRALHVAEEGLSGNEETIRGLIREVQHYQGWWLNEYYCLKVALKLARNQNDEGVRAMRTSSHARFMKWSGSHQP